ncbi:MAG: hypothetical protein M3N03_00955 [Actinomycetota bacterium]|nr:hypothetical protein [Actinomycetota bacterium]
MRTGVSHISFGIVIERLGPR